MGDLAWINSERRITAIHDGNPVDIVSTQTMMLERGAKGWSITRIHRSSRSTVAH